MYIEAFALHKKYGGKGIHYIGGYNTSTSNTLDKKDGGNVTTQGVGTYHISFIIVILQSLVSSLISIVRQRERERKPKRQRRVSSC